jgi:hypothetical protein
MPTAPFLRAHLLLLAAAALAASSSAQSFQTRLGGGNTCGFTPCEVNVTDDQPLTEISACSDPEHFWSGAAGADRGILGGRIDVRFTGGNTLCSEYKTHTELSAGDLVISGPAGPNVPFTLRMRLEFESLLTNQAFSNGDAFLSLTGFNTGLFFNSPDLFATTVQDLQLAGSAAPNVPLTLSMTAMAGGAAAGPFFGGGPRAQVGITFRFPIGEPVFDLPPGYTVDSPTLNIVDNLWLGPDLCAWIQQSPAAQQVCAGETAQFGVSAAGEDLEYRWLKDGVELADGATGNGSVLSGTATPTLSVQGVSPADAGTYECAVLSCCGTLLSAPAELTIVPGPTKYCTAKVNSQGCLPVIHAAGTPSAGSSSGFEITCSNVREAKPGLLFYGLQPANTPFQGGFLCVGPPLKRAPPQTSTGTAPCDATYSIDFNAYMASSPDPILVQGAQLHVQWWMRDPQSPSFTGLSNALTFSVCP